MLGRAIAILGIGLLAVACGAGGGDGAAASDEGFLRTVAQQRFARDGYDVTQAEFQQGEGGRWYVIQLADPTPVIVERNYETWEGIFERPMKAYADVLDDGELEKMNDVETFILAFRDETQSVIEIPRNVMEDWVHGRVSLAELRDLVRMSALTG